jgi:dipeptidase D
MKGFRMDKSIENVLKIFENISAIPRCSKKEEKISEWITTWAKNKGFSYKKDEAGNIAISVPSSGDAQNAPTIVLQGHLDMVCEKTPDSGHDFSRDPIRLVYEGDKLRAKDTSLGADNGIGVALALAAASDDSAKRPPLELLFTLDEETGLKGAGKLGDAMLSGKILINIDSESDDVFTVGCAGGQDTVTTLPIALGPAEGTREYYRLKTSGLKGGHSGVNIHEQRANAIKLLARVLLLLMEKYDVRLVSVEGGSAHNAIPREASALLAIAGGPIGPIRELTANCESTLRKEFETIEPNLKITLEKEEMDDASVRTATVEDGLKMIRLLCAIPHGVYNMSYEIEGLVETSSNLATVKTEDSSFVIATSQRSSVMSKLEEVTGTIKAAAMLAGAKCEDKSGYPSWQPDLKSPLLKKCVEIYERLHGEKPNIKAIHAGLECGVIGSKYPGMDMISIGPNIEGAHSPAETLDLNSLAKIKELIDAILKEYASV